MARFKRKRSIIIRLLVIVVSGYMIYTLIGLWNDLNVQEKKLFDLNNELEDKKSDVDDLKNLLENGSEQQIVETAARQRLGFVYSNEEIYVDISGK